MEHFEGGISKDIVSSAIEEVDMGTSTQAHRLVAKATDRIFMTAIYKRVMKVVMVVEPAKTTHLLYHTIAVAR